MAFGLNPRSKASSWIAWTAAPGAVEGAVAPPAVSAPATTATFPGDDAGALDGPYVHVGAVLAGAHAPVASATNAPRVIRRPMRDMAAGSCQAGRPGPMPVVDRRPNYH